MIVMYTCRSCGTTKSIQVSSKEEADGLKLPSICDNCAMNPLPLPLSAEETYALAKNSKIVLITITDEVVVTYGGDQPIPSDKPVSVEMEFDALGDFYELLNQTHKYDHAFHDRRALETTETYIAIAQEDCDHLEEAIKSFESLGTKLEVISTCPTCGKQEKMIVIVPPDREGDYIDLNVFCDDCMLHDRIIDAETPTKP